MKSRIRNRGRRRQKAKGFELPLTSMMDVLVIILIFILKSYQTSTHQMTTVKGIEIPTSNAKEEPLDSHYVIVTPEGITFEDQRVVSFLLEELGDEPVNPKIRPEELDEGGRRVRPLFDALVKAREASELLRLKSTAREDNQPLPIEGVLAIQADRRVPYELLRRIMYTAGSAGYSTFRLLAKKREE